MDLLKNPFHVLTASPRDSRRRIMELAEERGLFANADECAEARSILTNPRKRLRAEMSWLPGISPKRTEDLLRELERSPELLLDDDSLSPLAKTNLIAAALEYLRNPSADELSGWLIALAHEYDGIDAKELSAAINSDRSAAGFPEVSELSLIDDELKNCRGQYRSSMKAALDKLPTRELVRTVTKAVEDDTAAGQLEISTLIADLVDAYEVEAQVFLEKEAENVDCLIEDITSGLDKKISEASLKKMLELLCHTVKNWDFVAQPVQVCARSRGLNHAASQKLARKLRNLALLSYNDYNRLEVSQQLTALIHEVFLEDDTIAKQAEDDARTLEELHSEREKEITYETQIGLFRKPFRISPQGIEWENRLWKLDSITRVRWGGVRQSVNGIPTGTTYYITFGTAREVATISTRNATIFSELVEKLWKAVGFSLLLKYINGLREGKEYHFGTAVLRDTGMVLERFRFFGENEKLFCPWNSLSFWDSNGLLYISCTGKENFSVCLSYMNDDNTHVLEAALRMVTQKNCLRISDLING